ncbi:MarC family protein [Tropicimonas marinistellae]|uniref:MarC family protein n=1 Tax=Tropicimonas marinistellae TaxID=1739787 RepID=UPI00082AECA7|nr:MarC family protein [Tropicimonas marinistellae]
MQDLLEQFVTLWVVIDPIGTIPVFVAVTAAMSAAERRKTALQAAIVSAGVLMFFLVFGQILIDALGIGLNSFQVAGGIVLFLFALTMIFGEAKQDSDLHFADDHEGSASQTASVGVFPLAVPSLASPGAMLAIVLLTDNTHFSIPSQAVTAAVMLSVLVVAYLCMRLADPLIRLIGNSGAAIVSRVMGMILASVAANAVLGALLAIAETGEL